MKKALVSLSLMLALASAALAFGDKDQGILKSENLRVLETPKAYPVIDAHVHIDATDAAFDLAVRVMDASGVAAVVNLGGGSGESLDRALALAAKYPGRFISLHLADQTAERRQAPVGKGVIDWKKVFAAMKTGGMRNYYVEMNMDALKESIPFLRNLTV